MEHLAAAAAQPFADPDTGTLRERMRFELRRFGEFWVFAYGSLMWSAGFTPAETHAALVRGWHRSLSVYATGGRGLPHRPGLWFGLEPGGSVTGLALRVHSSERGKRFDDIWRREMPDTAYRPVVVRCRLRDGRSAHALAFAANRMGPLYAGRLPQKRMIELIRQGRGPLGSSREYVERTAASLRQSGMRDRTLQSLVEALR